MIKNVTDVTVTAFHHKNAVRNHCATQKKYRKTGRMDLRLTERMEGMKKLIQLTLSKSYQSIKMSSSSIQQTTLTMDTIMDTSSLQKQLAALKSPIKKSSTAAAEKEEKEEDELSEMEEEEEEKLEMPLQTIPQTPALPTAAAVVSTAAMVKPVAAATIPAPATSSKEVKSSMEMASTQPLEEEDDEEENHEMLEKRVLAALQKDEADVAEDTKKKIYLYVFSFYLSIDRFYCIHFIFFFYNKQNKKKAPSRLADLWLSIDP